MLLPSFTRELAFHVCILKSNFKFVWFIDAVRRGTVCARPSSRALYMCLALMACLSRFSTGHLATLGQKEMTRATTSGQRHQSLFFSFFFFYKTANMCSLAECAKHMQINELRWCRVCSCWMYEREKKPSLLSWLSSGDSATPTAHRWIKSSTCKSFQSQQTHWR